MTTNDPPSPNEPSEQPPLPGAEDHTPAEGPSPQGFEPIRPSDWIDSRPVETADESNRTPIIAGAITALIVLVGLGWFILANRQEPVASPLTSSSLPPITTLSPDTTSGTTGSTSAGYEPRIDSGSCLFDLITEVDFSCGWLVVPEDRQAPGNGRQVRIHYAYFESPNPDAPADPIVYLDGGPGGSTLDPLTFSFTQAWEPLLENRDLIMFDQRGVGFSKPSLDCPEQRDWEFSVLDQDLTAEQERAGELESIGRCHARLTDSGVDLAQYNSVENAADVNDLRVALGLEEVNLLGISYGTRLATAVMRDHPDGIRSVILDSTYTPDVNLTTEGAANFDRALSELWQGCEEDADCAATYPDLENRFFALVDRYEQQPAPASVRNFLDGGSWEVLFDGEWLLGTVFQGLYSDQVIPLLPQMIEELEAGETATLSLLTSNTLALADFLSLGMMLSVQCNEEISFTTQDAIDAGLVGFEQISSVFDGASNLGDYMLEACDLWQAGAADPAANQPVESDIPTLVLAGEYDPITPPAWGASAAAYLDNSTYVEFPGLGHGTSISGDCPLSITFGFVDAPTEAVSTSCVGTMSNVDFKIPGESVAALQLVEFTEDVLGTTITGVVPDGWESVGFGAYARGDSAIDQTAILQQVAPLVGVDTLVSLLANQFGMGSDPTQTGTVESDIGTWSLFNGDADGFFIDIGAIDLPGSSAVVVVISDPSERDQLFDDLFIPAVEAFRVVS